MKFLVVAPAHTHIRPFVDAALRELKNICGAEFELVILADFSMQCTYFEYKINKLGLKNYERLHNEKVIADFISKCELFKPDFILILDAFIGVLREEKMRAFLAERRVILWLWDSFERAEVLKNCVRVADEIFCFEYDDVAKIREFNAAVHYLPLGADTEIYCPADCRRDIDISFVGAPYEERIYILEKICARACQKNWAVKIVGGFLNQKHFYRRMIFKMRHAHLSKFVASNYYNPAEVADLYRRSKICLNLNAKEHRSLSPRTFEICATKSFQLMNSGQDSHGLLNLETDLATFDGVEDLLEKIECYLANEELRKKIAAAGFDAVIKNCTLKKSVEKLLAESEIVRACGK